MVAFGNFQISKVSGRSDSLTTECRIRARIAILTGWKDNFDMRLVELKVHSSYPRNESPNQNL